ncbi:MAG: aminoglycoside 3'-phosphotransferase [Phycisphaeraceae bacterium]
MTFHPSSGKPVGPVAVPAGVRSLATGDRITPVWRNELGGLTFRLENDQGTTRYVKWIAAGTPEIDLAAEAKRLEWARRWVRVPRVLEQGSDNAGSWLLTTAVPGRSAVEPRWTAEPKIAAAAIGRGLRVLHDTLPVDQCPFDWSIERRLAQAHGRIAAGEQPSDQRIKDRHPNVTDAQAQVHESPPIDRLVVCHGDACAPNTLLHDDGTFSGHVDLDTLGIADPWADLAVGAWSTEWNYGPGYDGIVYEAYGINPDPERIAYYRLLWDMS